MNIALKPIIMDDITFLEEQLLNKRMEYFQAIKDGAVHRELKKIHLELKTLREKLAASKQSVSIPDASPAMK
jgi:hypothetical protein